jgi:hypothetical protein
MRSGLTIMISCQDKECSGLAREQVHRIRGVEAEFQ